MASNFDRKSLFAEHLKGGGSSTPDRPSGGANDASLDDLFGSTGNDRSPSRSNRGEKSGRVRVKPW